MLRNVTALAAVLLAVSAASLGVTAAPAGAAAKAHTAAVPLFTDKVGVLLCTVNRNPMCMQGYDGLNGFIKGYPPTPGRSQRMDVTQLNNCGGTVTHSCPFTVGSGLNNAYFGDTIVGITVQANSMSILANPNDVVLEAFTGTGQVWVVDGFLTGANAGALFVNVAAADRGDPTLVCSDGVSGHDLEMPSVGGECNWQAVPGN
jgi:hypothetical protein